MDRGRQGVREVGDQGQAVVMGNSVGYGDWVEWGVD